MSFWNNFEIIIKNKVKKVRISNCSEKGYAIEYDRKNSSCKDDLAKGRNEAEIIGGVKELAKRSLLRAEGKCACNCECTSHVHENVTKIKGNIKHCGNSILILCKWCTKKVCEVCIEAHYTRHGLHRRS